jgi:hypothetical protein
MKENLLSGLIVYRNLLKDNVIGSYSNLYSTYEDYDNLKSKDAI